MAIAAIMDSASADGFRLLGLGASNANQKMRTGSTSKKMVRKANQIAKVNTTPSTAAVMADNVALITLLLRRISINGATRNIHKKVGTKVTQILSTAPNVPATMGDSAPGLRY